MIIKYYCSICFPKNTAAVSANLLSNSPNFSSSLEIIITEPITSPSAIIGDITWLEYLDSSSSLYRGITFFPSSPKITVFLFSITCSSSSLTFYL